MANILNQIVVQENIQGINKRMIIQYTDDVTNDNLQSIVDYDALTAEEKTIFDNFITLIYSKIVL